MRKLPKPRSSTLSPLASASVMLSKTVLTMVSVSFFVRFDSFETSSISSAFVIVVPPSALRPLSDVRAPGQSSSGPRGTLARPKRECQTYWGVSTQSPRPGGRIGRTAPTRGQKAGHRPDPRGGWGYLRGSTSGGSLRGEVPPQSNDPRGGIAAPALSVHQVERRPERRQARGQQGAGRGPAELATQEVHDGEAAARLDDGRRRRQAGQLARGQDRLLQAAQRVHHLQLPGLHTREDASVGEALDLLARQLAPRRHRADELSVDIVEQGLHDAPLVRCHRAAGAADVL